MSIRNLQHFLPYRNREINRIKKCIRNGHSFAFLCHDMNDLEHSNQVNLPRVTVIMPLKGFGEHNLHNWRTQVYRTYTITTLIMLEFFWKRYKNIRAGLLWENVSWFHFLFLLSISYKIVILFFNMFFVFKDLDMKQWKQKNIGNKTVILISCLKFEFPFEPKPGGLLCLIVIVVVSFFPFFVWAYPFKRKPLFIMILFFYKCS